MDEPTRRAWSKPELIVLVRSRAEEAVLGVCKTELAEGPIYDYGVCSEYSIPCNQDVAS